MQLSTQDFEGLLTVIEAQNKEAYAQGRSDEQAAHAGVEAQVSALEAQLAQLEHCAQPEEKHYGYECSLANQRIEIERLKADAEERARRNSESLGNMQAQIAELKSLNELLRAQQEQLFDASRDLGDVNTKRDAELGALVRNMDWNSSLSVSTAGEWSVTHHAGKGITYSELTPQEALKAAGITVNV